MSPEKQREIPKRFYKGAQAGVVDAGFGVLLDGRPVRTPAGARLVVPVKALAQLLAAEWAGQGERIDLSAMPATRLAFSAIDRVAAKHAEVAAEVGRYAGADMLCYFADGPGTLVERQIQRWGPVLNWARDELGLTFRRATGIIHRAQPPETIAAVESLALAADDYALAGLAMAAGLYGSAVLALALYRDRLSGLAAFELSRLDEEFQEEKWGVDAEALARRGVLTADATMLDAWFQALR
jgi:chaperone required for assembly of F1-ATPase